uniref:Piwi domain-containing protein n=1 Tax=Loa loa TaxID=7209 RepID=A0A1I7VHZ3_LOALO
MEMRDPLKYVYIPHAKQQNVEPLITEAKSLGATFIHFVTADELNYHAHIKYIESQEQVVTQDLKASTALSVTTQNKRQTLDNIVNKTNIKLGGLNYSVHLETNCDRWLTKTGLLIVGLDIAHPYFAVPRKDRSRVPSVIGYSANIKKHPLDFIGGYRYGKAEVEELTDDTIQQIFSDILRYFNANRGEPPKHLFVIRDGISTGQYKYVMNTEVEQIKKACQMVGGPGFRPHITFIVLTKMHSLRIYRKNIRKQERAVEQNIKPGTIVDKHVVNPVLNEFYLNSHSAAQGTTKTPRYTLLFDTSGMEADVMQGIVHALAYNFQIVNMAVSLPCPVMIAARMAKRGRCNYIAMYGDESENSDNGSGVEKDLIELNNQLSYISKPLEAVRFNA